MTIFDPFCWVFRHIVGSTYGQGSILRPSERCWAAEGQLKEHGTVGLVHVLIVTRGFLICDLFRVFLLLNEVGWKTDSYPMAGHLDGCSGAQARGPRQNSQHKLPFDKLT